jgi:hypothetical protein
LFACRCWGFDCSSFAFDKPLQFGFEIEVSFQFWVIFIEFWPKLFNEELPFFVSESISAGVRKTKSEEEELIIETINYNRLKNESESKQLTQWVLIVDRV